MSAAARAAVQSGGVQRVPNPVLMPMSAQAAELPSGGRSPVPSGAQSPSDTMEERGFGSNALIDAPTPPAGSTSTPTPNKALAKSPDPLGSAASFVAAFAYNTKAAANKHVPWAPYSDPTTGNTSAAGAGAGVNRAGINIQRDRKPNARVDADAEFLIARKVGSAPDPAPVGERIRHDTRTPPIGKREGGFEANFGGAVAPKTPAFLPASASTDVPAEQALAAGARATFLPVDITFSGAVASALVTPGPGIAFVPAVTPVEPAISNKPSAHSVIDPVTAASNPAARPAVEGQALELAYPQAAVSFRLSFHPDALGDAKFDGALTTSATANTRLPSAPASVQPLRDVDRVLTAPSTTQPNLGSEARLREPAELLAPSTALQFPTRTQPAGDRKFDAVLMGGSVRPASTHAAKSPVFADPLPLMNELSERGFWSTCDQNPNGTWLVRIRQSKAAVESLQHAPLLNRTAFVDFDWLTPAQARARDEEELARVAAEFAAEAEDPDQEAN